MVTEFMKVDLTDHLGSSNNSSAIKHSFPCSVYDTEFYRIFKIEYSLIGIARPKFSKEMKRMLSLDNHIIILIFNQITMSNVQTVCHSKWHMYISWFF